MKRTLASRPWRHLAAALLLGLPLGAQAHGAASLGVLLPWCAGGGLLLSALIAMLAVRGGAGRRLLITLLLWLPASFLCAVGTVLLLGTQARARSLAGLMDSEAGRATVELGRLSARAATSPWSSAP